MAELSEPAGQIGRRARSRLHVRLAAQVVTRTRTVRGVLRDLSLTGAGIAIDEPLRPGEDVLITWAGFEAFGRVVHMRSRICGIEFEECVPPSVLIATRDLHDAARLPDDRDLARQRAHDWAAGISRL